jgi:Ca2+-binding EF-hand superfamily protein
MNRQFNNADADGNGYIDKSEMLRFRNLQLFFDVADRDHDGKLSRAELELYLERQSDARRSRVILAFGDHGRNLFELLDADGDRRLGVRELRQAGARLAAYDRNGHGHGNSNGHGDDRVARSAVPRVYRLGIGRGLTPLRPAVDDPYASPNVPSLPGGREAPAWFAKMDRNRDGDVSRREFLGTPDQFRRLDDDGDGLIDPREAGGKQ